MLKSRISYGPDNYLWITESKSCSVSRINIADGKKTEILNLSSEKQFADKPWPQAEKLYLITDRSAVTSGPTKEDPQGSSQKGAIIEFTYTGE